MAWLSSFFGSGRKSVAFLDSPIDIITYLASLASKQQEVDAILDDLRRVTARLDPGMPLSAEDQDALAAVHDKLVQYLLEKESLRKFTREELAAKVGERFKPSESSSVFWQKIAPVGTQNL